MSVVCLDCEILRWRERGGASEKLDGSRFAPPLDGSQNIELRHALRISRISTTFPTDYVCAGQDNGKAAMLKTVEGWDRPESEEASDWAVSSLY